MREISLIDRAAVSTKVTGRDASSNKREFGREKRGGVHHKQMMLQKDCSHQGATVHDHPSQCQQLSHYEAGSRYDVALWPPVLSSEKKKKEREGKEKRPINQI